MCVTLARDLQFFSALMSFQLSRSVPSRSSLHRNMSWSFLIMITVAYDTLLWTFYYDFAVKLRPFVLVVLFIVTTILLI
jgi:hypothetical protein